MDIATLRQTVLAMLPESQRAAATVIIADYGPKILAMAQEEAWSYIRRIMAGDLDAVTELDTKLSDAEFIAKVKANTERWSAVANYNVVRADLRNQIILKVAPIVLSMLLAAVGL